ncbi:unnamed protein product [Clonostachys rhizophaga]|uniref:BZIP domain-containing protein n=1 Tax=Clonostachys rhizophaga TaxID=160324 RepID=A0A9N9VQD5_9HYPO|nr:unnamed protein product [Clonostachys rhizophaga]
MNWGQASNDDWSGISDPSERRKIQNRLNQRAKRNRNRKKMLNASASRSSPSEHSWGGHGVLIPTWSRVNNSLSSDQRHTQDASSHTDQYSAPNRKTPRTSSGPTRAGDHSNRPGQEMLIPPLVLQYSSHTGLPKIFFPLSPDHKLITLVQYNLKRALLTNMNLLGNLKHLPRECESVLSLLPFAIPPPPAIPSTLLPTELQLITPHNPLIDSVPFPEMRNNLILEADKYDMAELASDGYGGLFGGFSDLELRGVIVWGDPWKLDQWEITDAFSKKYQFLLANCGDLIESTNRWRESRGEDRLIVEI